MCLMWFISRKGAKLAKALGLLCLCCGTFERFAFAKTVWVSLCFAFWFSFVSFVVNVRGVGFSQRRGGAEVLPMLCLCCVFWGFAFAEAMSVNFTLRLMCSYVNLCGSSTHRASDKNPWICGKEKPRNLIAGLFPNNLIPNSIPFQNGHRFLFFLHLKLLNNLKCYW